MLRKFSRNMDKYFNMATPAMIEEGLNWYNDAHQWCVSVSKTYNVSKETVAGVLSSLSPRNKWERNKQDTIAVIEAVRDGKSPEDIKVCTFNSNKYKAFGIAKGSLKIYNKSRKTYAFVQNISYLDPDYVTIDVWHQRVCMDKFMESQPMTAPAYKQIQELTIKKAHELGLKGYEYQAILWVTAKNFYE